MKTVRIPSIPSSILTGTAMLLVVALVLGGSSTALAQDLAASNAAIEQMRASSGPELRVSRSARTGLATFIGAPAGTSIPVPDRRALTPRDRAISFVDSYGMAFGLRGSADVAVSRVETDDLGVDHVRLRQVVSGVPVTGGELIVHLRGSGVLAANGKTLDGLDFFGVIPAVPSNAALNTARLFVTRRFNASDATLSEPRLEVFNQGILGGKDFPTRLAWFVEARELGLRQFIWIDATNGIVLLNFSQLTDAKNRQIYNGNSLPTLPGTLIRSEGGVAAGGPDADNAYDFSGHTYDYFFTNHARDSYNGAGAPLLSTIAHCPTGGPCPYQNAFWNGTQMVYGAGFSSADDVVAHELTHAVTEYSANLFYYMQSGALNESFSDIFGETVDLENGAGNDGAGVRWFMGEDLTGIGAIRNMMTPTAFGDPGKMTDTQFKCETDPFGDDAGGVHTNSGVPNHAYALMVDGGTYNSITVAGIGLTKAAKIQYRALTQYLISSSDFLDNYNALQQACTDLVGTAGITSGNCAEVKKALDAVQMSNNWPCSASYGVNSGTPALCSAGQVPVNSFFDGFETGLGNWVVSGTAGTPLPLWMRTSDAWGPNAFVTGGTDGLWGYNQPVTSEGNIRLASNLTIPAGARLQFNHSFGFENGLTQNYDGGLVEYSINGGSTWSSLSALHAAGANYNGTILVQSPPDNPFQGQSAFVKDSFGFTASQYNLASLAGQTQVRFRFRIGTDDFVDDYGWFVDDFRVYTCATPTVATGSASSVTTTGATLNGTVNPGGVATSGFFEYGLTASYGSATSVQALGSGTSSVALSASLSGLTCDTTYNYRAVITTPGGTTNGSNATFTTTACSAPLVVTSPATLVGSFGATLNGTVNPSSTVTPASGFFQYGLTTSYGSTTASQNLGAGSSAVPFSTAISGLTCATTYHFRAVGTNTAGTANGSDLTFVTATCPPIPPPVTWTQIVGVVATGNSLARTSGTAGWDAGAISNETLPSGDGMVEFTATETNTNRMAGLGVGNSSQSHTDIEYAIYLSAGGSFFAFESGVSKTGGATYSPGDRFSVGVESGVVKYRRNGVLFYTSLVAPTYPLIVDTSLFSIGATITDARVTGFLLPPPALTINDVSVTEGNAGSVNAVFTVTLSSASLSTVTVSAVTANNTAVSGSDYTTTGPTTLTFTPGVLTQTFTVPVLGDTTPEINETFFVNLTSPSNATIADAQGVGTITNDDLPPAVSWTQIVGVVATGNSLARTSGTAGWDAGAISNETLPSGDGMVEFTATETNTNRMAGLGVGNSSQSHTDIEYAIYLSAGGSFFAFESGVSKTAGATYSPGDRFSVGVESGVVKYRRNGVLFYTSLVPPTYPLIVDTSLFSIGATITDARVSGFLLPPPALTINDVSVTEGNAGSVNAVFTVTLSSASLSTVTVSAVTANNTALSGSDYTTTGPTTLTFSPGSLTQTFTVPVLGDTTPEINETFFVNLTSPSNATIADAQGIGTITNDDLPPAVSWTQIVGVVATGNSLSRNTGTAGWDAGAISNETLPSGDGMVEFTATETNTNRMAGLGVGNSSQSHTDIEYAIYLSAGGSFFAFESGVSKTAGATYSPGDRFSVGVESGGVKYRRNGVLFYTSLVAPTYPLIVDTSLFSIGATITDARVSGFLLPPPALTINDVSVAEGNAGSVNAVFTVTLSSTSLSTVTVSAVTANNTALSGSDYTTTGPTTLTFSPGILTQTFTVPVLGDTTPEVNETFFVNLTSPSNATIADAQGIGTITNDDLPPAVSWTQIVGVVATGNSLARTSGTAGWDAGAISNETLPSGDGMVEFTATETNTNRMAGLGVGNSSQSHTDIEYAIYLSAGGSFFAFESGVSKTAGATYSPGDRFSVGVESGVVKYRRNGVLFYTSLVPPTYPLIVDTSLFSIGATITDARVSGFLLPPPALTINDVSVTEGNAGSVNAVFTVTLSSASLSTVTVSAVTANNTALSGSDYTTTGPTTLTFSPGILTQTFTVPVLGDTTPEINETFFVNLTSPSNATIADAQGIGTITNDDLPPAVSWTQIVGVVATGNSLARTSGTAGWDAGAISNQNLPSGDGMVEFTATETNTNRMAGLGVGNSSQSHTDIEYAIYLSAGGSFFAFESGVSKTAGATYSPGDRFSVGVESGVVKYRRNGVLFYTSLVAPTYPLIVDTSLHTIGATVTDVRVSGFTP